MDREREQAAGDDQPAVLVGVLDDLDELVDLLGWQEVGVVEEDGAVGAGRPQGVEVAAQPPGAGGDGPASEPGLAVAGGRLQEDDGWCRRPADTPQEEGSIDSRTRHPRYSIEPPLPPVGRRRVVTAARGSGTGRRGRPTH